MQRRWSAVLVKLLFVLVAFGWIAGCQTSELTSERPPEEANNLIEHTGVEAPATNPPVTIVEEQDKSIEMPSAEQKKYNSEERNDGKNIRSSARKKTSSEPSSSKPTTRTKQPSSL
ncbi:hypothetical protein [Caldalkalibacillus mannanilyticus]|uniref:hypothetical protein n=1 Tax=Caldalkalibacillus mannanilyticus TaxID=1418 RepID=UPI001F2A51BA|nr:hypothetical protein [Caldalkalibacillus mannanilyticus]